MIEFILSFSQRVSSGVQNGFGYSKKSIGLYGMGILLLLFPFFTIQNHWIFYFFLAFNTLFVLMKTISFTTIIPSLKKYKDIHLWENFVTGGYYLFLILSGYNILLVQCSIYPALILHKGFINIGSKLPFFSQKTDDETGKTYGIPILGIKIKRSSNKYRLIMAGLSIISAFIILYFKFNISIFIN